MAHLPPEIILLVLGHLDAPSLCAASRVCKAWHQVVVAEDQALWKRLAQQDGYLDVDEEVSSSQTSWKDLYSSRCRTERKWRMAGCNRMGTWPWKMSMEQWGRILAETSVCVTSVAA